MAKIPFTKLGLKVNNNVHQLNYNDNIIEVKEYLPIKEKLELVSRIINLASDDNGYYNPMKIDIFMIMEILYAYTNLNFTDKMKEELFKTYDVVVSSGIVQRVINIMGTEYDIIRDNVWSTIKSIYEYKNSAAGVISLISQDYSNVNLDLDAIQEKIENPEQMEFLKQVLPLINAPVV